MSGLRAPTDEGQGVQLRPPSATFVGFSPDLLSFPTHGMIAVKYGTSHSSREVGAGSWDPPPILRRAGATSLRLPGARLVQLTNSDRKYFGVRPSTRPPLRSPWRWPTLL